MKCLCCGKEIKNENGSQWHKSCVSSFFGTEKLPSLEIDDKILEQIAVETVGKGYTVPGVQKKLSLHLMSSDNDTRLTLVNYPSGYILKPQVEEYENLPEAEHLVMHMAEVTGIATVPHALIGLNDNSVAYITKRVDRILESNNMKMLAMEDFCQLDNRLTQDKYRGSYERCAKIISNYSSRKVYDLTEFYIRLIFSFIVGNSDMHLKNFSLIETYEASGKYVLSPAYDLLPVNVILPEDEEETALALNGKKKNLRKNDFLKLADVSGISEISANKMIKKVCSFQDTYIKMCKESGLSDSQKEMMCELMEERVQRLL